MPNLNLNEDPRRRLRQQPLSPFKKPPITGGGSKMLPVMVLFGLLIFIGVILFLLNQTGYINLWGEKSTQIIAITKPEGKPVETTHTAQIPVEQKEPDRVTEIATPKEEQKIVEQNKTKQEQKAKEGKTTAEVKKEIEKKVLPKTIPEIKNTKLTGGYSIFIGSFRDRKRAEEEAQRWTGAGFEVAISEKSFNSRSGKWYRVHIGNFSDREEARKLALKLADAFEGGYWIDVVK